MKHVFLRYHKPAGVLSTTLPTRDGRNILQSLSNEQRLWLEHAVGKGRFVVTIGRLDKDSTGLLLLTTNESITGALLRPGEEGSALTKVYMVETRKRVQTSFLETLRSGVELSIRDWGDKEKLVSKPCVVERVPAQKGCNLLRFELREGKNRQIRKMLGSKGHAVKKLCRTRFGPVELGDLAPNELAQMTDEEVDELLAPVFKNT